MENSDKLTLVIPAYNEENSLRIYLHDLVSECKKLNYFIIIVNDGSTDGTGTILSKYEGIEDVVIIKHKVNKGYGAALKTGISSTNTNYVVTFDADGQHKLKDVTNLYNFILETDGDLVIGRRNKGSSLFKRLGKRFIRSFAKLLMPLPISDLNSGMKIYKTSAAKGYLRYCPDTMAFSDIITLLFIYYKNLVLEIDIDIHERKYDQSKINIKTAFVTINEILNIVMMFNPIRIFLPAAFIFILIGVVWGIPIVLAGRGISIASSLSISVGIIILFFGLIAEQISQIRKQI